MIQKLLLPAEESQAYMRAIIVTLLTIFISVSIAKYNLDSDKFRILITVIIYSPVAWLAWLYIRRHPLPIDEAQGRIQTGIVMDTAMIGLGISICGFDQSLLYLPYLLYLWVIMGNGMRFGRHLMTSATLASMMSLSVVAFVSPQWPLPMGVTIILLGGLLMVDMFCRRLLKHMEDQAREIMHLSHDLHSAHLGMSETGLLEKSAFVDFVQEAMASLPDGNLLVAVVIGFSGQGSERIGNPLNSTTKALSARINSELRGGDLATLGREDELWMCIEPKRMIDATAVAERLRRAFQEIVPNVVIRIGVASYPHTNTDAHGLFNAASRNALRDEGKKTRLSHLALIENDN